MITRSRLIRAPSHGYYPCYQDLSFRVNSYGRLPCSKDLALPPTLETILFIVHFIEVLRTDSSVLLEPFSHEIIPKSCLHYFVDKTMNECERRIVPFESVFKLFFLINVFSQHFFRIIWQFIDLLRTDFSVLSRPFHALLTSTP